MNGAAAGLVVASEALKATVALIAIFGVLFPAMVTGMIIYAIVQGRGEKSDNDDARINPRL